MTIFKKATKALTTRPYMILEYGWKCVVFSLNYAIWKLLSRKWLKIGANPHIMNSFIFRAEKPDASIKVGDNFTAYKCCQISAWGNGRVTIGNNCSFGSRTKIDCRERVEIGNYVLISWDVAMADFEGHPIDTEERAKEMEYSKRMLWPQFGNKKEKGKTPYVATFKSKPIVIEDKVWIGARVMILKGVRIGYGSIVAAGAIVAKDIPPFSVAAGNPAVVVKELQKESAGNVG